MRINNDKSSFWSSPEYDPVLLELHINNHAEVIGKASLKILYNLQKYSKLIVLVMYVTQNQAGSEASLLNNWGNPAFWILGLGFNFFTGILAGSYPALHRSSFKPGETWSAIFGQLGLAINGQDVKFKWVIY